MRRCQKVSLCLTEPETPSSKSDPLLARAEPSVMVAGGKVTVQEKLQLERVVKAGGQQPCRHKRQQKEGQEVFLPEIPERFPCSPWGRCVGTAVSPSWSPWRTPHQSRCVAKEAVSLWEDHTGGNLLA